MAKNDVAKIKTTLRDFSAACTAGDVVALRKTLASNVVFMPPDTPKISGRERVARWAQTDVFDVVRQKLRLNLGHVQVAGAEALIRGSFSVDVTPKAGGDTVKRVGKHVAVFRKQKDGSWKYGQAIWNFDKPPA